MSWYSEYLREIESAIEDQRRRIAIWRATSTIMKNKYNVLRSHPNIETIAKRIREVKIWSIDHLDELVKRAKDAIEDSGGYAYIARTSEEAIKIVCKIVGEGKLIIKSKSMTCSEIDLDEHLIKKNNIIVETDLGERIIQLRGEKPSHIVVPAVHVPKEDVAELFSRITGRKLPPDIYILTQVAREMLRKYFMEADVGISGANAIVAETGTIFIVENEGNARFVTNAPPVHICIAGFEKIVPEMRDACDITTILAPYATGTVMPSYVSLITGPSKTADIELTPVVGVHGPKELHVILLDNGRTKMASDPRFKEALYCIRCGSCMNECPIYQVIDGTFGHKYFCGIGAIWTAFTSNDLSRAAAMAFTCTLCGRCTLACPLEINIPEMIISLRRVLIGKNLIASPHRTMVKNIIRFGDPHGAYQKYI